MVYTGAENIISPLGNTAAENFEAMLQNKSGLRLMPDIGNRDENIWASSVGAFEEFDLPRAIVQSVKDSIGKLNAEKLNPERTLLLLSTTKGEVTSLKDNDIEDAELLRLKEKISNDISEAGTIKILSNACISGVLGLIVGHDLIAAEEYDNVIVCGADKLSEFTIAGFQSFFAISENPCTPFDKDRTGISLGEAVGTIVLSKNKDLFKDQSFELLGGCSANDANHISGPSRTGEGLYRAITRTLKLTDVDPSKIDFLSAHGTGTAFNDEMESIAFERSGLIDTPLNSLKGYFGHTFGAAGVIETSICLQSMRNDKMIASAGLKELGTSREINVLKDHQDKELNTVMKTASGFGGCNASIIIRK